MWPQHGITVTATTVQGMAIPPSEVIQEGQALCVYVPAGGPLCPQDTPTLPHEIEPFLQPSCTTADRLRILQNQAGWMSDDQILFGLRAIAQDQDRPIQLVLLKAYQVGDPSKFPLRLLHSQVLRLSQQCLTVVIGSSSTGIRAWESSMRGQVTLEPPSVPQFPQLIGWLPKNLGSIFLRYLFILHHSSPLPLACADR